MSRLIAVGLLPHGLTAIEKAVTLMKVRKISLLTVYFFPKLTDKFAYLADAAGTLVLQDLNDSRADCCPAAVVGHFLRLRG